MSGLVAAVAIGAVFCGGAMREARDSGDQAWTRIFGVADAMLWLVVMVYAVARASR